MTENQIVRAWKDTSFRATLNATQLAALPGHPAGTRLVEIGVDQLQNVTGAAGCGWICSLTADCRDGWSTLVLGC